MSLEASALVLAWMVLVIMSFALAGLIRQVYQLSSGRRLPSAGPAVGFTVPPALSDLVASHGPTLWLFADDGCDVCRDIVRAILNGDEGLSPPFSKVLVLFRASVPHGIGRADTVTHVELHGGMSLIFAAANVSSVPYGAIVNESRRVVIAKPVGSLEALRALRDSIATEDHDAVG